MKLPEELNPDYVEITQPSEYLIVEGKASLKKHAIPISGGQVIVQDEKFRNVAVRDPGFMKPLRFFLYHPLKVPKAVE